MSIDDIKDLATSLASERSLIGISLSLQRQEHGEQGYWAATTLAAMLGHIGLPGGGIAFGYGTLNMSFMERKRLNFSLAALPQGANPVKDFIPVARLTDMLEQPGAEFDYNGQRLRYPDIGLVYWAGGNPFHHHQDLNRLEKAWGRPETIIVNEMYWTATARRADIVFPAATALERNDFAAASGSTWLTPMHRVAPPFGESKTDFEIYTALAERLGYGERFTEGLSEMQWLQRLYGKTAENAAKVGVSLPPFDEFWNGEALDLSPQLPDMHVAFDAFRADPEAHRLNTPSGRIELYSSTIDSFNYPDCVGHAAWYPKSEWAQRERGFGLHLVSNQPASRLHSQLDHGEASRATKVAGREPIRIARRDAEARGIVDGDIVKVWNERGATLAGACLSDELMPGVVQLSTGAWYDPRDFEGGRLEVHGNPNALTRDAGTSRLTQACTAQSCMVEVARFDGVAPDVRMFRQPEVSSTPAR